MNIAKYIFLFLAIAVKSNGQAAFVLEGTIGKKEIVMLIDSTGGKYFYKDHRHDIDLFAKIKKPGFFRLERIDDYSESGDSVMEYFELTRSGSGFNQQLDGTWGNGKTKFPVQLKSIDTVRYQLSRYPDIGFSNSAERVYNKVRLATLKIVSDSVTRQDNYELRWLHETETGIQYFELISGYSAPMLKKINAVFREKFMGNLRGFFECNDNHNLPGNIDYWFSGSFFSADFISIRQRGYWECGGAHPSSGDISFTIDAHTGKEVKDLEDLFWFTGRKPPTENDKAYFDYVTSKGKAIASILTSLYPAEMRSPLSEDSCDYSNEGHWQFPAWYFTKHGLFLGASFSHAQQNCGEPEFAVIPYRMLSRYKAKSGK